MDKFKRSKHLRFVVYSFLEMKELYKVYWMSRSERREMLASKLLPVDRSINQSEIHEIVHSEDINKWKMLNFVLIYSTKIEIGLEID